ncbi:MAG: DUF1295 domain-containing protein [Clostridia bacterium]|nr:DUF1295 domain-containing protein [Clostridia bacterium]
MGFKQNRALSFLIVALVYVLATAAGVISYLLLPFNFWLNLLLADIIATVVTFIFSLIFKNASVYDPYWSVQPIVIVVAFAIGYGLTPTGIILTAAICYWGVRLTANWAYTFLSLNHQDWRYTHYQKLTGVLYPVVNFFGIHLMPTLIVYACTMPAVFAIVYGAAFNVGVVIFAAVSVGATTIQLISDIQMQKFRKNKTGGFIRVGLWKYSRHPNYLGEILMWWGIALATVCVMPNCWYLIAGAAANTLLFLCVSVPLADGKQSKKEGFLEYKKATRMLLPIKK